jgi:hypothetical protein
MQSFLNWLDQIGDINKENSLAKWLERIAFIFLILMILAAPHSIAATQIAWLAGMFAWFIRLFIKPRPKLVRTPLDAALWAFFGWTVVSSVFSYAPDISIDKLRNAALFLIFYFIINVVRTKRAAVFLTFGLIFSTTVVALLAPIERVIGRGVEISGVTQDSPLAKARLLSGDTLLEANKKKIRVPEDLVVEAEQNETIRLLAYRPDYNFEVEIKRGDLLKGENAIEKLGIGNWQRSRNWRSAGFYSHFTNFAEVLQLVGSVALGLFIALISYRLSINRGRDASRKNESKIFDSKILLLGFSAVIIAFALIITVTRGSQAAFLLSAFVIVLAAGNRKLIFGLTLILLPTVLVTVFIWQQSRTEGVVFGSDGSTQYRLMMLRDGFRLWTDSARNFVLGVGMDSIKRHWLEWNLFDKGWQPMGHFHSTPLQIAVERGFPALLLWLWVLWAYARTLWRKLKSQNLNFDKNSAFGIPHSAFERGILLGALGGLIGFFISGLVHYNYGAAVVAMIFFIIMGLSVRLVVSGER